MTTAPSSPTFLPKRAEVDTFEHLQAAMLREQGVDARSYFLARDGDRPIHVLEAGRGDPLIFLHGGGSLAAEWASLIGRMQSGYRCIAVDRPGHGLTYRVDYRDVPFFRTHAASFVARTMDLLELERGTLVASSMGGFFALAFALASPERVDALALIGAPAGIDRWLPPPLRLVGTPLGALLVRIGAHPSEEALRGFHARWLVSDPSKLSASHLRCLAAAYRMPGALRAGQSMLSRFRTVWGVDPACYLRDELPAIVAPTLFVWGAEDRFAPPSSGRAACERMDIAHLEVIPRAGHLAWLDAPDDCARILGPWLRSTSPTLH